MAEAARAPPAPALHFAAWVSCSACKQDFTGLVQLRLAIALWAKNARLAETDGKRLMAAGAYAAALDRAGEYAKAVRLRQGILDVCTRTLGVRAPHDSALRPETWLPRFCALESTWRRQSSCEPRQHYRERTCIFIVVF